MNKSLRDTETKEAIKLKLQKIKEARKAIISADAAKLLGRLGGLSGSGDAKRRPSEICRAAVNKRWDAYRKEKMSRRAARAD